MRLEARVTLWLLVLLGAGAAVTLVAIGWTQARVVDRHAQETARLLAESVTSTLNVSMLNNSPGDIEKAIDSAQESTLMDRVAVYGRNGEVWVASGGSVPDDPGSRAVLTEVLAEGVAGTTSAQDTLSVYVPVANQPACSRCHSRDSQVLGAVGVTVNEGPLRRELSQGTRASFLIALLPLMLGIGASVWAVRRGVLRPMATVGAAAQKLAAGDLSARVPPIGGSEFDSVGNALNEMASKLERRARNLARTVDDLRFDLEGLEHLQALIASGAGLGEVLEGTAAHVGATMGANGVGIWRLGGQEYEAEWGLGLPPVAAMDTAEFGAVVSSSGALEGVPEETPLSWCSVPASRSDQTLAVLGVSWDPPRSLLKGERDLLSSLASLVAVAVENTELLERLKGQEESLEGLIRKTLNAQEEERRRVARELHDETSQVIHGVMMNIEFLETQLEETGASEELRARFEAVRNLAEQAGRNLDKVMFDLRPALLDELGLVAALRWSLAQTREAFGVDIGFEPSGIGRMSEAMEMVAFRIVQEAVSNAVKHSGGGRIDVAVLVGDHELRIKVSDDGEGFDAVEAAARGRTGEAAGLLGMKERAELLGGRLVVSSVVGGGTTVVAEIPLSERDLAGADGTKTGETGS